MQTNFLIGVIGVLLVVVGVLVSIQVENMSPAIETESSSTKAEAEPTGLVASQSTLSEGGNSDIAPPVANKRIDLSGQGLTRAPQVIFDDTDTQELDLSNNKIEGSLQAEVRFLKELLVLDLSDNNLTGVPAEIGQLEKLKTLDLSNNDLTGLPYELGDLRNLAFLDLRGNDYAKADLEVIKKTLPAEVTILVD